MLFIKELKKKQYCQTLVYQKCRCKIQVPKIKTKNVKKDWKCCPLTGPVMNENKHKKSHIKISKQPTEMIY